MKMRKSPSLMAAGPSRHGINPPRVLCALLCALLSLNFPAAHAQQNCPSVFAQGSWAATYDPARQELLLPALQIGTSYYRNVRLQIDQGRVLGLDPGNGSCDPTQVLGNAPVAPNFACFGAIGAQSAAMRGSWRATASHGDPESPELEVYIDENEVRGKAARYQLGATELNGCTFTSSLGVPAEYEEAQAYARYDLELPQCQQSLAGLTGFSNQIAFYGIGGKERIEQLLVVFGTRTYLAERQLPSQAP